MSTSASTSSDPAFVELPDLAAEELGGAVLLANDDFFADKENLLRAPAPVWREGVYTERGKWMDGWETRRRREPGYDWCVIRLGLPGHIRGVVVDTAFFRGNYPESCTIEACEIDDPLDVAALAVAAWTVLLQLSPLQGDKRNFFTIAGAGAPRRFTHLRLNIFPDGGVARLRVHGDVVPRWSRLRALGGPIDLAALEHGAVVESASDMFFGSRANLIKPGPSRSMADGWETRRRRGPGNDWAIVRLAASGVVERLEVDTSHFKGNAPGQCVVEGCHAPGVPAAELAGWRVLLTSRIQPHTRHVFDDELRRVGLISHLRLSVFPDGGVARLRVWGAPEPEVGAASAIGHLNGLSDDEAIAAFLRCCGAARWAERMAAARPFEDPAALLRLGERHLWQLGDADWLEAFAAHPRIGETSGGRASPWSGDEQRAAAVAGAATLAELAAANQAYVDRFGFVFLICATGRSAEAILGELRLRLEATRGQEVRTAAEEQAKITRLRLRKLVEELS